MWRPYPSPPPSPFSLHTLTYCALVFHPTTIRDIVPRQQVKCPLGFSVAAESSIYLIVSLSMTIWFLKNFLAVINNAEVSISSAIYSP